MNEQVARGDRVTSIYGDQHQGEVIGVDAFNDGTPMFLVRRDSDGFVWVGWPATVRPLNG